MRLVSAERVPCAAELEPARAPGTRAGAPQRLQRETKIGGRAGKWVRTCPAVARVKSVQVVLRKLGKGSRAVAGRLVRAPRKGSVVVIEFPDGMHEYVTTPVKRVLRLAGREVFYIETINSRYRLEGRGREDAVAESAGERTSHRLGPLLNVGIDERRRVALYPRHMGKFDRRNSQKMKRRKGQVKKKARLKRVRTASAKTPAAKKTAA